MSPLVRSRLRRVLTVGGTLLFLFLLWETVTYFVAYTDDAYVRSDLVAVAPDACGRPLRPRVPMVGRQHERRRVLDAFDQAVADRSCRLFTVLGPAGI